MAKTRNVHLALYGSIEHDVKGIAWQLFQTEALTRLRDISLSSTPSRFAAHGMAASRFEHSVGVAHLAATLCDQIRSLEPYRNLLIAAALCHDIGSPPFSHISELFLHDLTGMTHEELTSQLLAPGTELHSLLASYDVEADRVYQIVTGNDPVFGPVMAGSIDLDNIDNSLHLLRSMGYEADTYQPLRLIQAFGFDGDEFTLNTAFLSQIVGWDEARKTLYSILHSDTNLNSAAMLYRALEFAYSNDTLDPDFFSLGESNAMYVISAKCGPQASSLLDRALRWKQFIPIHKELNDIELGPLVALYSDWRLRKQVTDEIADRLGVPRTDIALYVGRDRATKNIDLRFVGDRSDKVQALFQDRQGRQRFVVFADQGLPHLMRNPDVAGTITNVISEVPTAGVDATPHVFF